MAGGLLLGCIGVARAEPPRQSPVEGDVTLEYHRGAATTACPDEAAFRERSSDSFDFHDPFVAPGAPAGSHMRIDIARDGLLHRGTLSIVDAHGDALATSVEEHADCDALVWVLGHRVALAILRRPAPARALAAAGGSLAAGAPPPSAPPPPTPSAAGAPAPATTPVPPDRAAATPPPPRPRDPAASPSPAAPCDGPCLAERPSFTTTVLAGGLMTAGWTAELGPGAWLGFEVKRHDFSLGLEGRGLFPARTIRFEPHLTSDAATFSGLLVPCAHWRVLAACAFFEAGSYIFTIPGRAPGVTDTLLSLGPRAALSAPVAAGFLVRAFADLAIHPYAPIFGVRLTTAPDSPIERWTTPIVSGFFGLGIGWSQ